MGASIRAMDGKGYTPLHYAVWKCKPPSFPTRPYHFTEEDFECEDPEGLQLLDLLLKALENNPESLLHAIYFDAVKNRDDLPGISPFLLACGVECESVVARFLSILQHSPGHESLPIEIFEDKHGINAFHYLIISSIIFQSTPRRAAVIQKMIDILPYSQVLLRNPHNRSYFYPENISPLQIAITEATRSSPAVADVIKGVLRYATVEELDQNSTTLRDQIIHQRLELVESFLRVGLPMADDNLYLAAASMSYHKETRSPFIELLLSFGYPLHNELYLSSDNELPIEVTSTPEFINRKELYAERVSPCVKEALMAVRRSNVLLSLQRQYRNKIRRQLRPRADEAIKELPLPEGMKRFLLVESEPPLLEITGTSSDLDDLEEADDSDD